MELNKFSAITMVENGMKYLSEVNLESLNLSSPIFLVLSLLVLGWVMFSENIAQNTRIDELGLSSKGEHLKINDKGEYLEFKGVKPSHLNKTYWRNNFEVLENILGSKFIDVKIIYGRGCTKVQLYKDNLPEVVPFTECPKLKPMDVWLGKNQFNEDVIVNLQESPSMYIDGKPGAGKTVAIRSIIEGYARGLGEPFDLVIITTKPSDFYVLNKSEKFKLKLIDPFEEEMEKRVEEILAEFNEIKDLEVRFKQEVKDSEIEEVTNLGELRTQGICEDTSKKLFVFDEAKDYLSKSKADSKEVTKLKQELISAVYTHIRRTARYLSIPIIVASQTQNEGDLDIPLKMFHLRLASNTNEAMSRTLCGSSILTGKSFNNGKYFVQTNEIEEIIKLPFR